MVNSRLVLNDLINCSFYICESHVLMMPNSYVMSHRFAPFIVGLMEHCVVEDVEEEKKRNRSTSAMTCTSVVRAHRVADKKAGPQRTSLWK